MNILMNYLQAVQKIDKKRYLTPLPTFIMIVTIWSYYSNWRPYYDFSILTYILLFPFINWVVVLCTLCYPHANYWMQSTWLYSKIFGNPSFIMHSFSAMSKLSEIDRNTPDDYVKRESYIRGTDGKIYQSHYLAEAPGGKRQRSREKQINFTAFFLIKDIILRYLAHSSIFLISPILFLIAVPILERKGLLKYLEKK